MGFTVSVRQDGHGSRLFAMPAVTEVNGQQKHSMFHVKHKNASILPCIVISLL